MTLEEQYRLSCYEELTTLGNHNNIYLVKHKLSGEIFVKKILSRFSLNVYLQLKELNLSGIPKIYDIILDEASLILIEDYIHGQTLEQLLQKRTVFSSADCCDIMKKLCAVLAPLHQLNPPIIHRDLKLSNIILTNENLLYIVDFDTARYYESGQEQDTELLGTKEYAPPEQYGFGQSDVRSDIYALGVIFNRLLTGEYPKHQLANGQYHFVISKCIRLDPEEHFQTVSELEAALVNASHSDIKKPRTSFPSIKSSSGIFNRLQIPGFRTGKVWKMVLASLGYLSFIYCSLTMELTEVKSHIPLTGSKLWYERIFVFLILISLTFYNSNYKNIRTRSFFHHPFPLFLRIILQCLVSVGIVIIFMFLMLLIEQIIW